MFNFTWIVNNIDQLQVSIINLETWELKRICTDNVAHSSSITKKKSSERDNREIKQPNGTTTTTTTLRVEVKLEKKSAERTTPLGKFRQVEVSAKKKINCRSCHKVAKTDV